MVHSCVRVCAVLLSTTAAAAAVVAVRGTMIPFLAGGEKHCSAGDVGPGAIMNSTADAQAFEGVLEEEEEEFGTWPRYRYLYFI